MARILLALALLCGGSRLAALDPLPDVHHGSGYLSWMLAKDSKRWAMEKLMERLRDPDLVYRQKAMKEIGFEKFRVGRSLMWPEIEQPLKVETSWLGIERRKLAVMTMPVKGHHAWIMILFRQDGNDEAYWRPIQFLKFDTDPVEGLQMDFPDINGEQIYFLQVKHLVKDDIYGSRIALSLFKFDEKQLRLTFQETDRFYRGGKFQGDPTKVKQVLKYPGDQHIVRTLEAVTFPFMKGPEFYQYEEENVSPRRTEKAVERFAWTPQFFSFYDPEAELEKLVTHKSKWVRRDAARRLGEVLKTTHPQLEAAMLKDKDAYVRAQCALALENIGDVKALPAVEKALKKWDEPENLEEAFQRAYDKLSKLKEEKAAAKPEAKAKAPKKAAEKLPPIATEGLKTSEKK